MRKISAALAVASIPLLLAGLALGYRSGMLPPEVYGVLLGSLLTLLGLQLKSRHDAKLKRLELDYLLRRDVYLEVAEGLASAVSFMERLAQPDLDDTQLAEQSFAWADKLELVASPRTVSLARTAARAYSAVVVDLLKRRAKLQKLDFDSKATDEDRSRLHEAERMIWNEFTDALKVGDPVIRDARLQSANERQTQIQQQLESNRENRARQAKERSGDHREIGRCAIRGAAQYRVQLTKLKNAIRVELAATTGTVAAEILDEPGSISEKQLDDYADFVEDLWRRDEKTDSAETAG